MWVLADRENAEEIGYPVVWEEIKPAENEVPYNIREEQTIDKSSVFTANNDTTTWMANVIPWVNAPKLIASTSIYWDLWGWWEVHVFWAKAYGQWHVVRPSSPQWFIYTFTLSEVWGTDEFENTVSWLKFPVSWWYQFEVTLPQQWGNYKTETYITLNSWTHLYSYAWTYQNIQETVSFRSYVDEWDTLFIELMWVRPSYEWTMWWLPEVTMIITKL